MNEKGIKQALARVRSIDWGFVFNQFWFEKLFDKKSFYKDDPRSSAGWKKIVLTFLLPILLPVIALFLLSPWVVVLLLLLLTVPNYIVLFYKSYINARLGGVKYALERTRAGNRPRRRIVVKYDEKIIWEEDGKGEGFVFDLSNDKPISESFFRNVLKEYLLNRAQRRGETQEAFSKRKGISESAFRKRRDELIASGEYEVIENEVKDELKKPKK